MNLNEYFISGVFPGKAKLHIFILEESLLGLPIIYTVLFQVDEIIDKI